MQQVINRLIDLDLERRKEIITSLEVAVHNGFAEVANKIFG